MDDDFGTSNEIIPEEKIKNLSLPSEMIQRGLDLAISIEQKQGIEQFYDNSNEISYTIRCYLAAMEWIQEKGKSPKLNVSDQYQHDGPVYVGLSINKEGLLISYAPSNINRNFGGIENNEDYYRLLNTFNDLKSFTIPFASLGIFYVLTHPADVAPKNLKIQMGPSNQLGYKGPITKETNPFYNEQKDFVEIVIVYISIFRDSVQGRSLVAKKPPIKLSFVAVDRNGKEDSAATYELYHAILNAKDPLSDQKNYVSIEELYENLPANIFQKKEWNLWKNAYEGMCVKGRGRIEGVSIHPREKKLYFIIILNEKENEIKNNKKQVVLSIRGAQKMTLGEKEGSFLFDDTKWICMGEIYTFRGQVLKSSRFDTELGKTEFRDLIIIKVNLTEIMND